MKRTSTLRRNPEGPSGGKPASLAHMPSKGLDRSLSFLEILAEEDGVTLSDVSLRAGVPASTAHRILTTLEAHKFVMQDEERGLWFIGVRAFEIGSAFLRNRKFVEMGRVTMRRLMQATGESINLAIEDDGEVVYVSQVECHAAIRAFHRPGKRGPMHALAVGKALLAAKRDEEIAALVERTGLARFTPRTITKPAELFADLAVTRQRGWSINDEERDIGMRAVAATVYNEYGEAIAALSISGPTSRLSDERIGECGPMAKRAAAEITASIGGVQPRKD